MNKNEENGKEITSEYTFNDMLLLAFNSEPPVCGAGMSFIGTGKQREQYFSLKNAIIEKRNAICMEEISESGYVLKYIPERYITEEMCLKAFETVRAAEDIMPFIPLMMFTPDVCNAAVNKYHDALKFFPDCCIDEKICMESVNNFGRALEFVSLKYQCSEMWETAVTKDGSNLQFVPEDKRSAELCTKAFENNKNSIKFIPEIYISEEMCLEAVKNKVYLSYIPVKMRTVEICFSALKDQTRFIRPNDEEVPKEIADDVTAKLKSYWQEKDQKEQKDWEVLQMICHHPENIKSLTPEQRRRGILCQVAVEGDGMLLRFVPKDMRNEDICLAAVRNDVDALAYVPDKLKPIIIEKIKNSGIRLKILFSESDYKSLFL